jgi:hypothetical protein
VRARQIAKAFGQDQQTAIPGNAAAAAFALQANSQPFSHRASFEVTDDTFDALRRRTGRPSSSLLATVEKRATLPMTLDEVEAYEQWRVGELATAGKQGCLLARSTLFSLSCAEATPVRSQQY